MLLFIKVKDNGRGIPKEKLDGIGGATSETVIGTAGEKGYALGMQLVNEMVESRKGIITVDSKLGVGTCVDIKIPIREIS